MPGISDPHRQPGFIDLTGKRFGHLTVAALAGLRASKSRVRQWSCLCDCGRTVNVTGVHLRHGHTVSCGCVRAERSREANTTHGASRTAEWSIWSGMNSRCRNGGATAHLYRDKGITVCERWRTFANFLADMGPRPSPRHSIDRIDGSKGYEPDNCRWALPVTQANNTTRNVKITHEGETLSAAQWADRKGIARSTVYQRIRRGVDPSAAITKGA